MAERDFDLDFEDLRGTTHGQQMDSSIEPMDASADDPQDAELDANCETFYWALKGALERTRLAPPPGSL